jgi:hypothetical protein
LARLLASARRSLVRLGLPDEKLFLRLTGAAGEFGKFIRSEEQRADDEWS